MWWDQWKDGPHDSWPDLWVMKSSVTELWHTLTWQWKLVILMSMSTTNPGVPMTSRSLKWLNRFLFCFYGGGDGGFYLFTMCKKISWPDLNLLVVVNKRKRPNCVDISALDGTGWHYMVFQVAKFKIKVGTHTDCYVSSRDISRTPLGQQTEESCVAKQWGKRGDER